MLAIDKPGGMSETARRMTRAPSPEERAAPIREYHAKTSGTPIKLMTYMLLVLTTGFAADLFYRKRFPHQRGFSLFDAFRSR